MPRPGGVPSRHPEDRQGVTRIRPRPADCPASTRAASAGPIRAVSVVGSIALIVEDVDATVKQPDRAAAVALPRIGFVVERATILATNTLDAAVTPSWQW